MFTVNTSSFEQIHTLDSKVQDTKEELWSEMVLGVNESDDTVDTEIFRNATLSNVVDICTSQNMYQICVWFVIVSACPTIFGNTLVLVSIVKFKNLHSSMYILMGNLAVADLILAFGIALLALLVVCPALQSNMYLCVAEHSLTVTSFIGSTFCIFLMSVERFLGVNFPLKHRIYAQSKTYIITTMTGCWLFNTAMGCLPIVDAVRYLENNKGGVSCFATPIISNDLELFYMSFALSIFVVNIVLYIRVYKTARQSHTLCQTRQRLKTHLMVIVFIVFMVCWFPHMISSTVHWAVGQSDEVKCIQHWTILFSYINSALNWIIYGIANRKVRAAFRTLIFQNRFCMRGSLYETTTPTGSFSIRVASRQCSL